MPEVFLTHTEPCESNCIPLPVAGPLRDAGPPTPHPTPPSNPIIAFLGLIIFFGFLFFCVAGWFFFGRENDYRWCGSLRSKGKKNVTGTAVNRSGAEHEMPSITSHESTIYDKDKKQIAGIDEHYLGEVVIHKFDHESPPQDDLLARIARQLPQHV